MDGADGVAGPQELFPFIGALELKYSVGNGFIE